MKGYIETVYLNKYSHVHEGVVGFLNFLAVACNCKRDHRYNQRAMWACMTIMLELLSDALLYRQGIVSNCSTASSEEGDIVVPDRAGRLQVDAYCR